MKERLIRKTKQNKVIYELKEKLYKAEREIGKIEGVVNYMAFMMLIRKGKMTDKYKNEEK